METSSTLNIVNGFGDVDDGETQNIMGQNAELAKAGQVINMAEQRITQDREFLRKNFNRPELITTYRPFCRRCFKVENDLCINTNINDYQRMIFVERSPERQLNRITNQVEDVGVSFVFHCLVRNCGASFSFTFAELNNEESIAAWKPPSQQLMDKLNKEKKVK